MSQCSRNSTHGFSGTSVYQIKYTVVSAYSGAFFLNSNAEALTTTINVIMNAEFDNVIEIDRNKQVLFDYSA
jgi:hypothetical protein